jgi:hypothetical protein
MLLVIGVGTAVAQISQDPKVSAVKNNSPLGNLGSRISIAEIFMILALITVGLLALLYIRNAPRFATDEDGLSVVRADRVVGGQAPRRAVDVSQAVPIVVAPPAVPSAAAAAPPAPVAAAPANAAPAAEAPAAEAPAAEAPAAEPATVAAETAPTPEAAPAAAPAPPAAPPAARPEVSLDQEVFDQKLEELLAAGTDRRVAEGQARRAAMIAARKKAEAEGAG